MYERFFSLACNPFGMTPDPRFHFQSACHKEALAALIYAVSERRGFMTLVGEVGTGKTTLINTLLEQLDRTMVTIQISHTTVDREELLRIIVHQLQASQGLRVGKGRDPGAGEAARLAELSRIELVNEFNSFVTGQFMSHRPPPLLIIDEAQNLSVEVLEEVRLLTNLEGPQHKLLQVLLAGQPELETHLLKPELRQLRQRIAVNALLEPLTLEHTLGYIAHRLQVAGCQKQELFRRAAVEAVWAASEGFPRTINVLCDQALVAAFALGMRQVDAILAQEVIEDVLCLSTEKLRFRKPKPYVVSNIDTGSVAKAPAPAVGLPKKPGGVR
jgi:type II secretory pathway predicted ATPase ExeA